MVLEMLLSDMPDRGYKWNDAAVKPSEHGELSHLASHMGVTVRPSLQTLRREQPPCDASHPAMAVNMDACIQCNRCVRACREEQVNDVIGYAHRGADAKIVFDLNDPMGLSSCVACGDCGRHDAGTQGHQKLQALCDGNQAGSSDPWVFARAARGQEHAAVTQLVSRLGNLFHVVVIDCARPLRGTQVATIAVQRNKPKNIHDVLSNAGEMFKK